MLSSCQRVVCLGEKEGTLVPGKSSINFDLSALQQVWQTSTFQCCQPVTVMSSAYLNCYLKDCAATLQHGWSIHFPSLEQM